MRGSTDTYATTTADCYTTLLGTYEWRTDTGIRDKHSTHFAADVLWAKFSPKRTAGCATYVNGTDRKGLGMVYRTSHRDLTSLEVPFDVGIATDRNVRTVETVRTCVSSVGSLAVERSTTNRRVVVRGTKDRSARVMARAAVNSGGPNGSTDACSARMNGSIVRCHE